MNKLAVSVNQLEVKKEKIAGVVKDFLAMPELIYRVPMPDKDMTISNPEEMKLSELNVKFATTELSRILEFTTKAKQTIDGFKAPVLALEKEISAKADSIKAALKAKQQAYLAKVKAEQDAINGVVNLIRETFHKLEIAQKTRDALLQKCMTDLDLGIQEIAIKHAKVPRSQKAEVKELLEEIQMKKEATVEIVEPEFVKANVVQTRAIEEKYTYSIADEKAYIKYCVENGLWESNLTIKPNMNMFKAWVKLQDNKNLPFIYKTLDLK
ncbi:MAG TPA: hypothetical protein PKC94_23375 [Leptospiraceae bacterium]|nr:hypothetical protein [Leptospiraceae bacterium]